MMLRNQKQWYLINRVYKRIDRGPVEKYVLKKTWCNLFIKEMFMFDFNVIGYFNIIILYVSSDLYVVLSYMSL